MAGEPAQRHIAWPAARANSCYNLIEADGDQMTISTRRWDGDRFDTHQRTHYARDGHEWTTV